MAARGGAGSDRQASRHRDAMKEIMWRAANNDWFEYPSGSCLHYFRFPTRYQQQARDGVGIFFKDAGPASMKAQPPLKTDEKEVLSKKILKFIKKGYIAPPENKIRSLIKYFAVPKGVLEGVVQDWRIVFHARANKLNDSVWAPSFALPTMNSFLRIVDTNSLMEDRDIGEMFLNFQLDPRAMKFAAIDLGPLKYSKEECGHRWMTWTRNLMGFKPSPYNSVRMYLVTEEIIQGDRHDSDNAFQYNYVMLNLPGTEGYKPSVAWISKRRTDGSLASDFVCFVDDQRISGQGRERVLAAGHAISSRESYIGIQDALRKWRAPGGSRRPGAWAGACVFNEEDVGIVTLTSQEKWDRMKECCRHWHAIVAAEKTALLDYKKLRSDRGFMVYVTQAYPSLKPYLKGFHLSLETWRGGRDTEGWKERGRKSPCGVDVDHDLEAITSIDELKLQELIRATQGPAIDSQGPSSGLTIAVPRFKKDLEALLFLSQSKEPTMRQVRSSDVILTAYYGFGDASSDGFGSTVARSGGLHGRYGLWARDIEDQSSNYRELRNLVDTVKKLRPAISKVQNCGCSQTIPRRRAVFTRVTHCRNYSMSWSSGLEKLSWFIASYSM